VPDPVYFTKAIRVTLQQIEGGTAAQLRALPEEQRPELVRTHECFRPPSEATPAGEAAWETFEARQDVCATAYWYQALPSPRWPALEPHADRVADLDLPPKP
jgi:hypothetical protein